MAQEQVDSIIQILRNAQVKKTENKRLQLEQDKQNQEYQQNKDKIDLDQTRLKQEKTVQDAQIGLAQKAADLLHQTKLQELSDKAIEGKPIAGDVQSPAAQTPEGAGFTPINPAAATSIIHNTPLGQFQAPTPQEFAKQQAGIQETLMAPQVAAKIKEELALQKAKNDQSEANKQTDFQRAIVQKSFDDARNAETLKSHERIAKMQNDAENSRAALQRKTQIDIAKLPYTFAGLDSNATPDAKVNLLQPYVDAIDSGDMSAGDLKKDFDSKGMQGAHNAVLGVVLKNGIVPLSDAQVKNKQGLALVPDIIANIDKLINKLPKVQGTGPGSQLQAKVGGLVSHADSEIDGLYKQIESQGATIAKNVSGDAGQWLQKALLDISHGGYVPDRYTPTATNVSVRNNFVKQISTIIDTALGSLPQAQKDRIKSKMGISSIPLMKTDGSYVNSSPAAAQQLTPEAQQLMQKYGIQ